MTFFMKVNGKILLNRMKKYSKVNKCFVLSIEIPKISIFVYWYYKQEIFRKIISCQYIMCKDIVKDVGLTNISTN